MVMDSCCEVNSNKTKYQKQNLETVGLTPSTVGIFQPSRPDLSDSAGNTQTSPLLVNPINNIHTQLEQVK